MSLLRIGQETDDDSEEELVYEPSKASPTSDEASAKSDESDHDTNYATDDETDDEIDYEMNWEKNVYKPSKKGNAEIGMQKYSFKASPKIFSKEVREKFAGEYDFSNEEKDVLRDFLMTPPESIGYEQLLWIENNSKHTITAAFATSGCDYKQGIYFMQPKREKELLLQFLKKVGLSLENCNLEVTKESHHAIVFDTISSVEELVKYSKMNSSITYSSVKKDGKKMGMLSLLASARIRTEVLSKNKPTKSKEISVAKAPPVLPPLPKKIAARQILKRKNGTTEGSPSKKSKIGKKHQETSDSLSHEIDKLLDEVVNPSPVVEEVVGKAVGRAVEKMNEKVSDESKIKQKNDAGKAKTDLGELLKNPPLLPNTETNKETGELETCEKKKTSDQETQEIPKAVENIEPQAISLEANPLIGALENSFSIRSNDTNNLFHFDCKLMSIDLTTRTCIFKY